MIRGYWKIKAATNGKYRESYKITKTAIKKWKCKTAVGYKGSFLKGGISYRVRQFKWV